MNDDQIRIIELELQLGSQAQIIERLNAQVNKQKPTPAVAYSSPETEPHVLCDDPLHDWEDFTSLGR